MSNIVIRLDIVYNGSDFKGYQKQVTARTVQGELESALKLIYKQSITTFCAGRTDTGVHALQQVASYKIPSSITISCKTVHKALNALLPSDINISRVKKEHNKFHARFSPTARTYLYIIDNSSLSSPFHYNQTWHFSPKIDIKKLKKTLKYFVGSHNFKAFCEKPSTQNYNRTIYYIKVKKKKNLIYVYIKGNSFLRRMIRNIMGTSVGIASKKELSPSIVAEILEQAHRNKNPFPTAPPNGLYFFKIDF